MSICWIKDLLNKEKCNCQKLPMEYIYGVLYRINVTKEDSLIGGTGGQKHRTYRILKPSFRYWYADPIIFWEENKKMPDVYMEVMDQWTGRGFIGLSHFNDRGILSKPKPILKEKFHLSFPHVFSHKGKLYMIPETSGVHAIRIYVKDNNVWKLYREFKYEADANIIVDICSYHITEDTFLLIAGENIKGKKTKTVFWRLDNLSNKELCDIKRLAINQDSEYLKTERNAGGLIKVDDSLYRVKQISNKNYGEGIALYKVKDITCNEYSEKYIKNVGTDLNYNWRLRKNEILVGSHTYGYVLDSNRELGYEVLDVAKKSYTFITNLRSLKSNLYKLMKAKIIK